MLQRQIICSVIDAVTLSVYLAQSTEHLARNTFASPWQETSEWALPGAFLPAVIIKNVIPELHPPSTRESTRYLPLQFTHRVTVPTRKHLLVLAPRKKLILAHLPPTLTLSLILHPVVRLLRHLVVGLIHPPIHVIVLPSLYLSMALLVKT